VRARQSGLERLLEAGSTPAIEESEAWASVRASLAIVTAAVKRKDQAGLAVALGALRDAAERLSEPEPTPE
jgi:hypothetical protein